MDRLQHNDVANEEPTAPAATYQRRCAEFGGLRDRYRRRSSRNGNISLALVGAALLFAGLWVWRGETMLALVAGTLALGFVASFIHHGRVDAALRRYSELFEINDEGLRRLRRDWGSLPLRQPPENITPSPLHAIERATAADLDLLGHASLQHLLSTPATPVGLALLRDWLLRPAAPEVAQTRQGGAAELALQVDFRDQLALRGRLMGAAQPNYERFLRWAEGAPWLPGHAWLLWAARLLPLVTLLLAAAQGFGLTPYPLWLLSVLVGIALSATAARGADAIIDEVAARQGVFETYADLFRLVEAQPFTSAALRQIQSDLTAGRLRADQQMQRLGRLMALADVRGWMFFYPIQLVTLWSVHVLWLLERWQRDAGGSARRWLTALGEIEALAALATLAHDHPAWRFPDLRDPRGDAPESQDWLIEARGLGHPLLPPETRVSNDVTVGPPGTFLLVTGSNMSGKSTLLRAIGLNVALAQAGGPVCAEALRLPPLALATSMRVQDSLEQGVSYFMAELQRLKQVVDIAERTRAEGERTPLFLLDEILHGTNTGERQIAVRHIIAYLLRLGATGAVSTHDLALAELPEIAAASRPVHFTETFAPGPAGLEMRFDYRLRAGVATSTNALVLVRQLLGPAFDALDGDAAPDRHSWEAPSPPLPRLGEGAGG